MSNWLFMGYPALIFTGGIFGAWAAIGLVVFMYFNWTFIAPKVRIFTEQTKSLTLNAYFENRFKDNTATIRVLSSLSRSMATLIIPSWTLDFKSAKEIATWFIVRMVNFELQPYLRLLFLELRRICFRFERLY